MDWLQIISAIGIGALLTKVLDIVWLQRTVRETEKIKWLRDQRLRVFSKLSEEILSLGTKMDSRENAFHGYSIAAEALLLIEEEKLFNDVEHFFTMIWNLYSENLKSADDPTRKAEEHLEKAYKMVFDESRRLVKELRNKLLEKQ